jgi:hypothetical protein
MSQEEFPSDLEQVPSNERVPVALGWTPLVLLAVALLLYEVLRRRNRTVLVARQELIGIYHKRKLVETISANQIVYYRLSWWNNAQYIFFPAVLTFGIFGALARESTPGTSALLAMLALGFAALGITSSLIRTRLMCVHFMIPKGQRGKKEILIPRSEVGRLSLNADDLAKR